MARYEVKVGSLKVVIDDELLYTESDEWVRVDGDTATVGVTDYAQKKLKDIVGVELPEPGDHVSRGDSVAVVESIKAAADVYAPLTGEITEVNEELYDAPEIINHDPYGQGWLFKIKIENKEELDNLLNHEAYVEKIKKES
ncbi:MAG: glycine cleavage system protein GcvH [Desulfurococcales archaeon]|nr:glycine cleavage system protein GcvH [Desulfurococcales archaeon]